MIKNLLITLFTVLSFNLFSQSIVPTHNIPYDQFGAIIGDSTGVDTNAVLMTPYLTDDNDTVVHIQVKGSDKVTSVPYQDFKNLTFSELIQKYPLATTDGSVTIVAKGGFIVADSSVGITSYSILGSPGASMIYDTAGVSIINGGTTFPDIDNSLAVYDTGTVSTQPVYAPGGGSPEWNEASQKVFQDSSRWDSASSGVFYEEVKVIPNNLDTTTGDLFIQNIGDYFGQLFPGTNSYIYKNGYTMDLAMNKIPLYRGTDSVGWYNQSGDVQANFIEFGNEGLQFWSTPAQGIDSAGKFVECDFNDSCETMKWFKANFNWPVPEARFMIPTSFRAFSPDSIPAIAFNTGQRFSTQFQRSGFNYTDDETITTIVKKNRVSEIGASSGEFNVPITFNQGATIKNPIFLRREGTNDTTEISYVYTPSQFSFTANTADAADTKSAIVAGGGALSISRGAYFIVYGNDHPTNPGNMIFASGTNGKVQFRGAQGYEFLLAPTSDETENTALVMDGSNFIRTKELDFYTQAEVNSLISDTLQYYTLSDSIFRGSISPAVPAVLAHLTSNQSIANATPTAIDWDVVEYDQFGIWNSTTGFVIPAWADYAKVTVKVEFASDTTGIDRVTWMQVNGSEVIGMGYDAIAPHAGRNVVNYTSGIFPVSSGDVITNLVNQDSGGALDVLTGTGNQRTFIQIELYENK